MKQFGAILLLILTIVGFTAFGVIGGLADIWFTNKVEYVGHKIDDATNYETIKKVEDTCRAMIASYESDKLTYMQYKDADNEEKLSWAEQAKMRANKTASTYNNFMLENSFVWEGNIPVDIKRQLNYIE